MPVQKEDLTGWGVGIEKNRGAADIFGKKREFPVSPEMQNSHWLKGNKNVIALTMADHDCMLACFVVVAAVIPYMRCDS